MIKEKILFTLKRFFLGIFLIKISLIILDKANSPMILLLIILCLPVIMAGGTLILTMFDYNREIKIGAHYE